MRRVILIVVSAVLLASGGGPWAADPVQPIERRAAGRDTGELRDPVWIGALIERFEELARSGDTLPLHALDIALRRAVDRELVAAGDTSERALALRLERAAGTSSAEEARVRDDAYRTPLTSRVDAGSPAPSPDPKTTPTPGRQTDVPELERRRKAVIHELSRLDPVLDDAGVAARRELLKRLLSIAGEARSQAP